MHRPVEILTPVEVRSLINACSNRAPSGIRNRALIAILYRCGLRIGEALALMPKDLDENAGTVRVLHGKGDKARTVGLDPDGFTYISRWIERRRKEGINGRAPLFCTLEGKSMMQDYIRALLPSVIFQREPHPHKTRIYLTDWLLDQLVDIFLQAHQSSAHDRHQLRHCRLRDQPKGNGYGRQRPTMQRPRRARSQTLLP